TTCRSVRTLSRPQTGFTLPLFGSWHSNAGTKTFSTYTTREDDDICTVLLRIMSDAFSPTKYVHYE
ncbi:Hypothetical protein FKW44_001374, partial [Caligus rogercresseyi]